MSEWQTPPPYPSPSGYPIPPGYSLPPGYPAPPSYPTVPGYPIGGGYPSDPLVSADYSGWFRRGVTIVKRGWKQLAALQAAGVVPALLVGVPISVATAVHQDDLVNRIGGTNTPTELQISDFTDLIAVYALGFAGGVVSFIVTAIITLAAVHVAASAAAGLEPKVGDALRLAGRRVLPLIGWELLFVPIALVAVCACVLPVLYVAAVAAVLAAVVAVERTNAVARCFGLFNNNLGISVGRIATIFGITIAAGIVSTAIAGIFIASLYSSGSIVAGAVTSTVVGAVLSAAVGVLVAPLTLTAYADMRARKDGITGATILYELGIASPAPLATGPGATPPVWPGLTPPAT